MPLPLVEAHLDAIVPLTAEETLREAERTALGANTLDKDARRDLMRELRTAIGVRANKATPIELSAAGIGVRRVPKRPTP